MRADRGRKKCIHNKDNDDGSLKEEDRKTTWTQLERLKMENSEGKCLR